MSQSLFVLLKLEMSFASFRKYCDFFQWVTEDNITVLVNQNKLKNNIFPVGIYQKISQELKVLVCDVKECSNKKRI